MKTSARRALGRVVLGVLAAVATCAATADLRPAYAGVVLLSRSSTLRVEGRAGGAPDYHETDGTTSVGAFSNTITGSTGSGDSFTQSSAQQASSVGSGSNGIDVMFAGTVSGQVGEIGGQGALGESALAVVFRVESSAEHFAAQGNLAGTLGGSASVRLVNDGTGDVVFKRIVDQGTPETGVQFDESELLSPGQYTLSVRTFVSATPFVDTASAGARFTVGATAIPLPPAVWMGMGGLLAGAIAVLGAGSVSDGWISAVRR
jgi:hypothetical protein